MVAALALATLYYGGTAFNKGSADAVASKILIQGQQILGASELYKADTGDWPVSMAALSAAGYLKAIPVVLSPMGLAVAADTAWTMPSVGTPVFVLNVVNSAVCQSINKKSYGIDGVLKTARTAYRNQCFGSSPDVLKTVVSKDALDLVKAGADPAAAVVMGMVSTQPAPTDRSSSEWLDLPVGNVSAAATPLVTPALLGVALSVPAPNPDPRLVLELAGSPVSDLTFPSTQVNTTSAAQTVLVRNTGNIALTVALDASTPFSLTGGTCLDAPLAPAATCDVSVAFSPTSAALFSGGYALSVLGDGYALASLNLQGTGTPAPVGVARLSTALVNFGSVATNTTVTRQVVLSNPGTGALTLTAAPLVSGATAFKPGTTTCTETLAIDASCLTEVILSPTAVGEVTGKLSYATTLVGSPSEVALQGIAYNPVSMTTGVLPDAKLNAAYSPYSFSNLLAVSNETTPNKTLATWNTPTGLPAGLSFNSATGILSGTPTALTAGAGASFTVIGTYKLNQGQQAYTIKVGEVALEVTSISLGDNHTCAVTTTGGAKCWGDDGYGQLGNDSAKVSQATPVAVLGLTSGVASISAGLSHTCAVTTAGAAKCWGWDVYGQLGNDAALVTQPTPVAVLGLSSGVASISAGNYHTCAVMTSGAVMCWGRDESGQLGNDAAFANQPTPVAVSGLSSGVASVSAGGAHTCAVTATGAALCWGGDSYGALGDDSALTRQPLPVAVFGLASGVASISAGAYHTCAVTTAGSALCWGMDNAGQLGNDVALLEKPLPQPVLGLNTGVTSIEAGPYHTCAVQNGAAKCWGNDYYGMLGDDAPKVNQPTPVTVSGLSSGVKSINAGGTHTCAVLTTGVAKCWGADFLGQLGNDAALTDQSAPVNVAP